MNHKARKIILAILVIVIALPVLVAVMNILPAGQRNQNVPTTVEETVVGGDTCPAVTLDGVTYFSTGQEVPVEPDESTIVHEELPIEGTGTVGTVAAYAWIQENSEGTLLCLIGNEWVRFTVK